MFETEKLNVDWKSQTNTYIIIYISLQTCQPNNNKLGMQIHEIKLQGK